jgi:hypothetical protein
MQRDAHTTPYRTISDIENIARLNSPMNQDVEPPPRVLTSGESNEFVHFANAKVLAVIMDHVISI